MKMCVNIFLVGAFILAVILMTYGITKGMNHDRLEKACVTDGWIETQKYRLVCQDIGE